MPIKCIYKYIYEDICVCYVHTYIYIYTYRYTERENKIVLFVFLRGQCEAWEGKKMKNIETTHLYDIL
jgi:hypothetical protein